MSPETAELARALVASPRWEWRVAMAAEDGDRVHEGRDVDPVRGWRRDGSILPDLDDPATAGVLLGMLLEAKPYGTRWSGPVAPEREQHVSVYVGDHREYFVGPTLGVAVGRALLARWEQDALVAATPAPDSGLHGVEQVSE